MTDYRVGIIGCGRIARFHVQGYQQVPQVKVVTGAEPEPTIREGFGHEFGLSALYADYREMLDKERPEIVSICTWPPLHAEMTIAAAEAGVKAIICEKPMAISLGEADAMSVACERAGTVLLVSHQLLDGGHVMLAPDERCARQGEIVVERRSLVRFASAIGGGTVRFMGCAWLGFRARHFKACGGLVVFRSRGQGKDVSLTWAWKKVT